MEKTTFNVNNHGWGEAYDFFGMCYCLEYAVLHLYIFFLSQAEKHML